MGCWDYAERPRPTKEQIEKFLQKGRELGFIMDDDGNREEKIANILKHFKQNPPVDYMSLMK